MNDLLVPSNKIFTTSELDCLNTHRSDKICVDNYWYYENELLTLLGIHDYHITLEYNATTLIHKLFEYYVDDETLVITSSCEHSCVKPALDKCKHKIILNYYDDIRKLKFEKITNDISKYKKVFVFMIGTQISSGEIMPQLYLKLLKEKLSDLVDKVIMCIDDAQGIFMVPRDYTIFDHIVNTAHTLVEGYDMGMLISKNKTDIGFIASNWLSDYIDRLRIMLPKLKNIGNYFNFMMSEYFYGYLANSDYYEVPTLTAPHIFAIRTNGELFKDNDLINELHDKYKITIENTGDKDSYIRFRAAHALRNGNDIAKGIPLLTEYLKKIDNVRMLSDNRFKLIKHLSNNS